MCPRLAVSSLLVLAFLTFPTTLRAALPEVGPPERILGDSLYGPFNQGSAPSAWGELDAAVVLLADNAAGGLTLWRTDGTEPGTSTGMGALAELSPVAKGREPFDEEMPALGDRRLVFVGDPRTGADLWSTDGTAGGTLLVAHLAAGSEPHAAVFEDRLYFAAVDPEAGEELWVSDGTPAGTRMAADLCPGACSSHPGRPVVVGDHILFAATDSDGGRELWTSDGTADGTVQIDLCPGACASRPEQLVALGDRLLFVADDGVHGRELWVSDGTPDGTRLLADFNLQGDSAIELHALFRLGNLLYFSVATGAPGEPRIWRTDGTSAATLPALELFDAGRDGHPAGSVTTDGSVYFVVETFRAGDGDYSRDLWTLEAPGAGPRHIAGGFVHEGESTFRGMALPDGRLLFTNDTLAAGDELWITDGTAAGTSLVRDLVPGPGSSSPRPIALLGSSLLFAADDGVHGEELWVSDGTAAGTFLLHDLVPERASPDPYLLTPEGPDLYLMTGSDPRNPWPDPRPGTYQGIFASFGGTYGEPLATAPPEGYEQLLGPFLLAGGGTALDRFYSGPGPWVQRLVPSEGLEPGGRIGELTDTRSGLFFGTRGRGQELWITQGGRPGTRLVADLDPGWRDTCETRPCTPGASYSPRGLTAVGDRVFFVADLEGGGSALWRSDGSAADTRRVAAPLTDFRSLVATGARLVFAGLGSGGRWQLWASDGTAAGTRYLAALAPGEVPGPVSVGAGPAFLVSRLASGGLRLWRSDGTPAGTYLVAPLAGTERFEDLTDLAVAGGRVYLSLFTAASGQELWTSDGTATGTRIVADIAPGPASSWASALTPLGSFLAFAAHDPAAGREPWITDGTAAGTRLLIDLLPGPGSSEPTELAWTDPHPDSTPGLYLAASDDGVGRNLWFLPVASPTDGPSLPVPSDATEILGPEYPGFRFWVRITAGDQVQPVRREALCIPETVCVSGALPGRSELFLRIVGPKPNGYLWPTLVRFSTSTIDVWIQQISTGRLRHYQLAGATPGSSDLSGEFDRLGFLP